MKKLLLVLLALIIVTGVASANEDMVKQKAKQLRDANNAQQGIAPATPAAPAAPGVTPAVPAQGMSSAQLALIDRLAADIREIKTNSGAKASLQTDLAALPKGSTKPTKADLAKLSGDLSTALAGSKLSEKDLMQLARNINISLNCSTLTASKAQTYVTEAQNLLQINGASEAAAKSVGDDLKGIVAAIQKNKPSLYQ